jgi:hypothetical protein
MFFGGKIDRKRYRPLLLLIICNLSLGSVPSYAQTPRPTIVQPIQTQELKAYLDLEEVGSSCRAQVESPYDGLVESVFPFSWSEGRSKIEDFESSLEDGASLEKLKQAVIQTSTNQVIHSWKKLEREILGHDLGAVVHLNAHRTDSIVVAMATSDRLLPKETASLQSALEINAELKTFNAIVQELNQTCAQSHQDFAQLKKILGSKILQDQELHPENASLIYPNGKLMIRDVASQVRARMKEVRAIGAQESNVRWNLLSNTRVGKLIQISSPLQSHVGHWHPLSCVEDGDQLQTLDSATLTKLMGSSLQSVREKYRTTLEELKRQRQQEAREVLTSYVTTAPYAISQTLLAQPSKQRAQQVCALIVEMKDSAELKEQVTAWAMPLMAVFTGGAAVLANGARGAMTFSTIAAGLNGLWLYSSVTDLYTSMRTEELLEQALVARQIDPAQGKMLVQNIRASYPMSIINLALAGVGTAAMSLKVSNIMRLNSYKRYLDVQGGATAKAWGKVKAPTQPVKTGGYSSHPTAQKMGVKFTQPNKPSGGELSVQQIDDLLNWVNRPQNTPQAPRPSGGSDGTAIATKPVVTTRPAIVRESSTPSVKPTQPINQIQNQGKTFSWTPLLQMIGVTKIEVADPLNEDQHLEIEQATTKPQENTQADILRQQSEKIIRERNYNSVSDEIFVKIQKIARENSELGRLARAWLQRYKESRNIEHDILKLLSGHQSEVNFTIAHLQEIEKISRNDSHLIERNLAREFLYMATLNRTYEKYGKPKQMTNEAIQLKQNKRLLNEGLKKFFPKLGEKKLNEFVNFIHEHFYYTPNWTKDSSKFTGYSYLQLDPKMILSDVRTYELNLIFVTNPNSETRVIVKRFMPDDSKIYSIGKLLQLMKNKQLLQRRGLAEGDLALSHEVYNYLTANREGTSVQKPFVEEEYDETPRYSPLFEPQITQAPIHDQPIPERITVPLTNPVSPPNIQDPETNRILNQSFPFTLIEAGPLPRPVPKKAPRLPGRHEKEPKTPSTKPLQPKPTRRAESTDQIINQGFPFALITSNQDKPYQLPPSPDADSFWKFKDDRSKKTYWQILEEALNGHISQEHKEALKRAKESCDKKELNDEICSLVYKTLDTHRYGLLRGFPIEPAKFSKWWGGNLKFITKNGIPVADPLTEEEHQTLIAAIEKDFDDVIKIDPFAFANIPHLNEHGKHADQFSPEIESLGINFGYYKRLAKTYHDAGKLVESLKVQQYAHDHFPEKDRFLQGRIMLHDQSTVDYLLNLGQRLSISPEKIEHLILDIMGHNDGSGLPNVFWNQNYKGEYGLPVRLEGYILALFDRYGQGNWTGARKILPNTVQNTFFEKVQDAFYTSPKNTIRQLNVIYQRALELLRQRPHAPEAEANLKKMYDYAVAAQQKTIDGYLHLNWNESNQTFYLSHNNQTYRATNINEFLSPEFQKALEGNSNNEYNLIDQFLENPGEMTPEIHRQLIQVTMYRNHPLYGRAKRFAYISELRNQYRPFQIELHPGRNIPEDLQKWVQALNEINQFSKVKLSEEQINKIAQSINDNYLIHKQWGVDPNKAELSYGKTFAEMIARRNLIDQPLVAYLFFVWDKNGKAYFYFNDVKFFRYKSQIFPLEDLARFPELIEDEGFKRTFDEVFGDNQYHLFGRRRLPLNTGILNFDFRTYAEQQFVRKNETLNDNSSPQNELNPSITYTLNEGLPFDVTQNSSFQQIQEFQTYQNFMEKTKQDLIAGREIESQQETYLCQLANDGDATYKAIARQYLKSHPGINCARFGYTAFTNLIPPKPPITPTATTIPADKNPSDNGPENYSTRAFSDIPFPYIGDPVPTVLPFIPTWPTPSPEETDRLLNQGLPFKTFGPLAMTSIHVGDPLENDEDSLQENIQRLKKDQSNRIQQAIDILNGKVLDSTYNREICLIAHLYQNELGEKARRFVAVRGIDCHIFEPFYYRIDNTKTPPDIDFEEDIDPLKKIESILANTPEEESTTHEAIETIYGRKKIKPELLDEICRLYEEALTPDVHERAFQFIHNNKIRCYSSLLIPSSYPTKIILRSTVLKKFNELMDTLSKTEREKWDTLRGSSVYKVSNLENETYPRTQNIAYAMDEVLRIENPKDQRKYIMSVINSTSFDIYSHRDLDSFITASVFADELDLLSSKEINTIKNAMKEISEITFDEPEGRIRAVNFNTGKDNTVIFSRRLNSIKINENSFSVKTTVTVNWDKARKDVDGYIYLPGNDRFNNPFFFKFLNPKYMHVDDALSFFNSKFDNKNFDELVSLALDSAIVIEKSSKKVHSPKFFQEEIWKLFYIAYDLKNLIVYRTYLNEDDGKEYMTSFYNVDGLMESLAKFKISPEALHNIILKLRELGFFIDPKKIDKDLSFAIDIFIRQPSNSDIENQTPFADAMVDVSEGMLARMNTKQRAKMLNIIQKMRERDPEKLRYFFKQLVAESFTLNFNNFFNQFIDSNGTVIRTSTQEVDVDRLFQIYKNALDEIDDRELQTLNKQLSRIASSRKHQVSHIKDHHFTIMTEEPYPQMLFFDTKDTRMFKKIGWIPLRESPEEPVSSFLEIDLDNAEKFKIITHPTLDHSADPDLLNELPALEMFQNSKDAVIPFDLDYMNQHLSNPSSGPHQKYDLAFKRMMMRYTNQFATQRVLFIPAEKSMFNISPSSFQELLERDPAPNLNTKRLIEAYTNIDHPNLENYIQSGFGKKTHICSTNSKRVSSNSWKRRVNPMDRSKSNSIRTQRCDRSRRKQSY